MSKNDDEPRDDEVEGDYEDWQYDLSTDLAMKFVRENLLPALVQFDHDHPEANYIPGVATYIAFTHIAQDLVDQGFTIEELTSIVQESADTSPDRVLH